MNQDMTPDAVFLTILFHLFQTYMMIGTRCNYGIWEQTLEENMQL